MRAVAENPSWATELFRRNCAKVNAYCEKAGLPMPVTEKALIPTCDIGKEYGVGYYGVVYPTEQPGIVFKITTDRTEAHFIKTALDLVKKNVDPDGIVRYHDIVAIPEHHQRRELFLIWREEAVDVGLERTTYDMREFGDLLSSFRYTAEGARKLANAARKRGLEEYWRFIAESESKKNWAMGLIGNYDEKHRSRIYIEQDLLSGKNASLQFEMRRLICMQYAWDMENASNVATYVGNALREFLQAGLLLADVHHQNVGRVKREGFVAPIYVITDPGHSVVWKKSLANPEIRVL